MFRSFYCVFPLYSWVALSSHFFFCQASVTLYFFSTILWLGLCKPYIFWKLICHPLATDPRQLIKQPPNSQWRGHCCCTLHETFMASCFCLFLYQLLSLFLGQESREPMSTGVWKSRWKLCLKVPLCCQKVNEMVIWLLKLCHERETWNFHLKCCIRSIISIYFG